jgi:hypothetical protein
MPSSQGTSLSKKTFGVLSPLRKGEKVKSRQISSATFDVLSIKVEICEKSVLFLDALHQASGEEEVL